MDEPLSIIKYKTANGSHICVEVSTPEKELLEQSDRQMRSQRRQDRRHHTEYIEGLSDSTIFLPQESIVDLVIRMDNYQQLYSAIDKLSKVQQRRLMLYYYYDLTYRQIAEIECVTHIAILKSVSQAIQKLRFILQ